MVKPVELLRVYQHQPEYNFNAWNSVSGIINARRIWETRRLKPYAFEKKVWVDNRDFYGHLVSRLCYEKSYLIPLLVVIFPRSERLPDMITMAEILQIAPDPNGGLVIVSNYSESCRIAERRIHSFFLKHNIDIRIVKKRGKSGSKIEV